METRSLFWAVLPAALLAAGCAGGGTAQPVKVRGVVKLDDKPIEGAMVVFLPADSKSGHNAQGVTRGDGSFQLSTYRDGDGALPGEYKVVVQYNEGVAAPAGNDMKSAMTGMQANMKKKQGPAKIVIPAQYSDPGQTKLRQKVPADGDVTFDLKSR